MTMTKRKKRVAVLLSLLAVLLLVAVLYVFFAVPFTWYRPDTKEVVEYENVIPTPVSVKYKKNFTHTLHEEDEARLIALFDKLIAASIDISLYQCLEKPSLIRRNIRQRGALEFRYDTRVKSSRKLRGLGEGQEFDAVWVLLSENGTVVLVRVLDGKKDGNRLTMCGIPRELEEEYASTVREIFANYNFEKPDWLK